MIPEKIYEVGHNVLGEVTRARHRNHDPRIEELSTEQKLIRIQLQNVTDANRREELKKKRNRISHEIRRTALANKEEELSERAMEVERLKDGPQMFKAVHLMKRRQSIKVIVKDDNGKIICEDKAAGTLIANHFASQLSSSCDCAVPAFTGDPKPLNNPISTNEVEAALMKLNNSRAAGPDDIPGELIKYSSHILAPCLSQLLNTIFLNHQAEPFLGKGTLIPLQKPGKPVVNLLVSGQLFSSQQCAKPYPWWSSNEYQST